MSDDGLGAVAFEPSCVVGDDPGEVVTHAHPTTEVDRDRIREQQIARLRRDDAAVHARNARISREQAIAAGRVRELRRA